MSSLAYYLFVKVYMCQNMNIIWFLHLNWVIFCFAVCMLEFAMLESLYLMNECFSCWTSYYLCTL